MCMFFLNNNRTMAANKNLKIKSPGVNTKQIILERANELINEVGVSDFRVDTLAVSLGLSPGNITYHFHKKEDIALALWSLAVDNVKNTYFRYVSSILDVKQFFVFLRALVNDNMKYVGVIAYKLGDVSNISDMEHQTVNCAPFMYNEYIMIIKHLTDNGCLDKKKVDKHLYMTFNTQLTLFCWWLNNGFSSFKGEDTDAVAERFAIAVIHPLTPFMTEEGLRQFENIDKHNK